MKRTVMGVIIGLAIGGLPIGLLAASSTNYRITESLLGGNGSLNGSSTNYKANSALGTAAVNGSAVSTNYQTKGGYVTTGDPALTFIVPSATINFGSLSTTATATATSSFSVIDYTSYGYSVQVVGASPSTGPHNLAPMTSAAFSQTGTEQFGLNLRANTSPATFGADASGGFGVAAAGYNTVNKFQFNNGDTLASSPKSSGQTNFTISYIANDATTTPGGGYAGNLTLVCTGTY